MTRLMLLGLRSRPLKVPGMLLGYWDRRQILWGCWKVRSHLWTVLFIAGAQMTGTSLGRLLTSSWQNRALPWLRSLCRHMPPVNTLRRLDNRWCISVSRRLTALICRGSRFIRFSLLCLVLANVDRPPSCGLVSNVRLCSVAA